MKNFYYLINSIMRFFRNPKRFIVAFFIAILIVSFCKNVFANDNNYYQSDSNYSQDPAYLIKTFYDNYSFTIIKFLRQNLNSGDSTKVANANTIISEINAGYFYYFDPISAYGYYAYRVNSDSPDSATTTINTHLSYGDNYISVPAVCVTPSDYNNPWNISYFNILAVNTKPVVYIPVTLYNYVNADLKAFCNAQVNGDITTVNQILEKIDTSIEQGNETLEDISQTATESKEALEQIAETAQDMNDFLQDDTMDSTNINLPTDNNNDITSGGFDSIFTRFYTAFTKPDSQHVNFPVTIPFANKTFYINSNVVYDFLGGNDNILIKLIHAVWFYVISVFIVKDIAKVIDKIKNGDIATSADTNIKADML